MPNPKQVMSAMQAISKAAESAGQKAPVTANKPLTNLQDFHTSFGDSVRKRAMDMQETMDSLNYKYDKGQRVFTEDSARKNFPPMTVLGRVLEGNRIMREDPSDFLSKKIIDEATGKAKRTPHEPGYKVRLEHSPDNWSEFVIPESAIKGAVDKANGGAMRMPAKKTQGFVEGTSYGKSFKDRLRQAAPLSPLGVGLNAGYAGYKYLTGEDPLEDLRRKLNAKINPDIDTGSESDQQFEKLRKGGAMRMQVGGLSALANLGKTGTLANRLSRAESAEMRARQFADPLNPDDIMRMSEALGYAGAEGKTLNLTQADRSRVFGANKGGTGFSGLQLTSPEHKKAKSTWGVGKPSHLTRLTKATDDDTIWSTFIGSPTQHMSNPVTTQRMYEAHRKANPSAKLVEDMNKMLNKAVDEKTGKPMFPNGIDISDPSSLNQAQTFNQRKLLAKAMVMGGEKKGEKATQEAFRIIKEETDPLLMESPTYAIGNRLFTIDKNSGLYRPDLNSAFPYISTGDDLGLIFDPAPLNFAAPQFVNQEKYLNRLDKRGRPSPISHKDLSSTTPKQFISEEYLTNLQKEGYKDGGSAEPKPFHDFDQIMKRKDGGTVNQSFEQQLMSALANYQANPDMLVAPTMRSGGELHMEEGGSSAPKKDLPDMSPQKYLELLALQPNLGLQSEKQIKAFLEEQYRKEKEAGGFADKQARIDRAIKTATPILGAGSDIGNFLANIPSYATEGLSAVGNYAMSKIPSMSKPASVLDTEGTGDRVPKYPLQSLPQVEPFYGSEAMQRDAKSAGLMGESESPIYDMSMQFLAPYGAYKAPSAIRGGLQMAKESPTLQKGAEYVGRGYSLAKVPVQRPFTPATVPVEATAPDLGQGTTYGFRQGLNDVLLKNPQLGSGRNAMREGQGTFTNTKEQLELNPLLAIDVPRAGNIGDVPNANKALRQQMAQMGVDLNQEAMAAHRFIPLATNNVRDASSALIKTKNGLTADEIAELAKALGGKMAVTHNPRLGGIVVFPFGSVREGLIPRELLRAQQAAEKLLGKRAEVQFGISDFGKDRAYMMAKEGDYQKAGAKPMSKEQQAQRERLQGLEKFLFPESRSGIPGQVKAAPVGGLQPWSVGPEYPTSVIGIGNGSRVQYQPRNFSTGQQGSKYDKYLEAEAERAKMLDEFHRALVPKYR